MSKLSFFQRINKYYDRSFTLTLSSLYLNGGFKVLFSISLMEIFRKDKTLSIDQTQMMMAFIMFPWDFKILYGIISDTVKLPFLNSFQRAPRRAYIMIFAIVQSLCLFSSGAYEFNPQTLMYLFFMISLCGAFMDTVIDGITCVQQRIDPVSGAQDLQTLSWVSSSIGSIVASIVASVMIDKLDLEERYTFFFYSAITFVVLFSSYSMNYSLENVKNLKQKNQNLENQLQDNLIDENESEIEQDTFCERVKKDYIIIKESLKIPALYRYYIYWLVAGLSPSFGTADYNQMKTVYEITVTQQGYLKIAGTFSLLTGIFIYQLFFKGFEFKTLSYISVCIGFFGSAIDLIQIFRLNLQIGIPDFAILLFGSTVLASIQFALSQLPMLVVFQKITPQHVEATMMALSASIVNLSRGFLGDCTGAFINHQFVKVTKEDMSNYYILSLIQIVFLFLQILYIQLIPVAKDIEEFQQKQEEIQLMNVSHEMEENN